jgi:acyl-CoA reductase-like NAD-dependent aldehyde dehydrogenase
VLPDADLEAAVPVAAASIFGNAGQVCVAGSRLFVHESGYEQVLDGVLGYARGLRLGSGLDPTTDMGPLVSQRQLERVQHYIGLGQSEGAETRIGGRRVGEVGYFVEPTVFTGVRDEMAIAQEEIFGPVLSVFRFGSLDELIARANSSRFGLSATVWTSDLSAAHRIAAGIKAGTVWVNNYGAGGPGVPFGGFKQSGWGRERGRDGVEAFLETKSVVVRI